MSDLPDTLECVVIGDYDVTLYLADDKSGHIVIYGRSWERFIEVPAPTSLYELSERALRFVRDLPMEDDVSGAAP